MCGRVCVHRFNLLTGSAFVGAFLLNAIFMVTGFLIFGGASKVRSATFESF